MAFSTKVGSCFLVICCLQMVCWLANPELQQATSSARPRLFTVSNGYSAPCSNNGRGGSWNNTILIEFDFEKFAYNVSKLDLSTHPNFHPVMSFDCEFVSFCDDCFLFVVSFLRGFFFHTFIFFRHFIGTIQIFFRFLVSSFSLLRVFYPRDSFCRLTTLPMISQGEEDSLALLLTVFPQGFFELDVRQYKFGWRYKFSCRMTGHSFIERVKSTTLHEANMILFRKYAMIAQAASHNSLIIDVVLLATALYNHYRACKGKGFGLHLAVIHFVRNQYPNLICADSETITTLPPLQREAIRQIVAWQFQEMQNNPDLPIPYPESEFEAQGLTDNHFMRSLVVLVSVITAVFGIFRESTITFEEVSKLVRASMRSNSALLTFSTATEFIEEVKHVFETLRNFWTSGFDFKTFFDCSGSLRELDKLLTIVDTQHTSMAQRLECHLSFELQQLLKELEQIKSQIVALYGSHPARRSDIRLLEQRWQVINDAVLLTYANAAKSRVMPFSIALVGASSIGKTGILDMFLHQFAADNPFQRAADQIDQKNGTQALDVKAVYKTTLGNSVCDQYFTGLRNFSWAGVFDDVCVTAHKISTESYAVLNSAIIRILNTFPYQTEQASIADKGRIFCSFQLVLFTSNVEDFSVYQTANNPAAVLRRINAFIRPTVKNEFRKSGTVQLDATKVAKYIHENNLPNGALLPIHTYTLWNYIVSENGKAVQVTLLEDVEVDELMSYLRSQWNEQALVEVSRHRRSLDVHYCSICRSIGARKRGDTVVCDSCLQKSRDVLSSMSVLIGKYSNHVVLSPIFEEMTKKQMYQLHYSLPLLAICLESVMYVLRGASWRDRVLPVVFHILFLFTSVSFEYGILVAISLHSVWNARCLISIFEFAKVWSFMFCIYCASHLAVYGEIIGGVLLAIASLISRLTLARTDYERMCIFFYAAISCIVSPFLPYLSLEAQLNTLAVLHLDVYDARLMSGLLVFDYKCVFLAIFIFLYVNRSWLAERLVSWVLWSLYYKLLDRFRQCRARYRNRHYIRYCSFIIAALSATAVAWYVTQMLRKVDSQGGEQSQPVAKGSNFWSNSVRLSSLAHSPGTQPDPFSQQVQQNVALVTIGSKTVKAFGLGGTYYLTTRHEMEMLYDSLPACGLRYRIVYSPERSFQVATGVVCKENFAFSEDKDFAIIELPGSALMKDLRKYFLPEDQLLSTKALGEGHVVALSKDGALQVRHFPRATTELVNVRYSTGPKLRRLYQMTTYEGDEKYITAKGDCGAVAYTAARSNCVIHGIHIAGQQYVSGVMPLSCEDIHRLIVEVRRRDDVTFDDSPLLEDFRAQGKDLTPGTHAKCPLNFLQSGEERSEPLVLGNLGSVAQRKNSDTNFRVSRFIKWWSEQRILHTCAKCIDFNVPLATIGKFSPPTLRRFGWVPKFRFCDVATAPKEMLSTERIQHLADKLEAHLLSNESFVQRLADIQPLSDTEVVNGIDGAKYVKAMNMQSSAGFPYSGPKKVLFDCVSTYPHRYKLPEYMMVRVQRMEDRARRRINPGVVFTATLKDEPLNSEKVFLSNTVEEDLSSGCYERVRTALHQTKYGKIRVFQAVNVETTFVVRRYYLPLVSLMQEYGLHTGIAVGTNCFSSEWRELYNHLVPTTWGKRFICGDFSSFDQRMGREWLLACWNILRNLLMRSTYYKQMNHEQQREYVNLLDSFAYDISNPTTIFFGDVLRLNGSNASGHPLTVIINGLANFLYMSYAFNEIYPDRDFFTCVRMMTYGDDNILNVHQSCDLFTQPAATMALAQINVSYTSADKSAVTSDYAEHPTFLKRSWRVTQYSDNSGEYEIVTCPIEFATIQKMLSMETIKFEDDINTRIIQVLGSVLLEFIQYGRSPYEQVRNLADNFVREHKLERFFDSSFPRGWPSYDDYMQAWVTGESPLGDTPDVPDWEC